MTRPYLPPAAFLLDFDGVLVRSNEAHLRAYLHAFQLHRLELPPHASKMIGQGASREVVMTEARVPLDRLRAVSEAKEAAFLDIVARGEVELATGARPFLEALRRAEQRVALVSNSSTAGECIRHMELGWAFDVVVDGTRGARPKPAPDLYEFAAELLQVTPDRCVAVEDSAGGARAARSAGTFVVGVGLDLDPMLVDVLYPNLPAIPLAEWLGEPSAPRGPQVES